MKINVQSKSGVPIYLQISEQIKAAILVGELTSGEALPSIRGLSADLKISVITTKKAYETLEAEHMVYAVPGKGFFVDNPDLSYLAEKRTLSVEDELVKVLDTAKEAGLTKAEVQDMVDILWRE